jgi:hypothetical protein
MKLTKIEEGNRIKSSLDGEVYTITRIVNDMAVLKSEDGKKQIMTELDCLKIFYRKEEETK